MNECFSENNSWILMKEIGHVQETDVYECVKFGADTNKNLDLMKLNVVS